MKKLLMAKECAFEAYIANLGLVGEEAHQYKLAKIVKEFIQNNDLADMRNVKFNEANLAPQIEALEDFTLEVEKREIVNTYINNIAFIADRLLNNKWKIIEKNVNLKLKVNNRELFLKIDLILQDATGAYFAVTVHSGKGSYTKKLLNYEYNLEWYLRSLFADELLSKYPGIRPAKLHLKECDDKNTLNSFLIIPQIDKAAIKKFDKELQDAINILVNKNSCKCPDYTKCNNCPARNICEFFKTNNSDLQKVTREKVLNKNMSLTKAQESLINSNKGNYRVLAGAGTGKTTTLSNKIVAMIQDGISPSDILVITFTEKGIQEIKEKIDYWLKEWFITEITSKDFPIYTFNGYGDLVLKENYKRFGYTAEPRLIDSVEKVEIIKEILDNFPMVKGLRYDNPLLKSYKAFGAIHQFQTIVDNFKKYSTDPIRFTKFIEDLQKKYPQDFNTLKDMIDYYYKYLHDNNLCEYEDQTNALVDICTIGYEDLFAKYGKDIIICDEFQDTDEKQLLFVRACTSRPTFHSLTMVGDDSQSVFAWRGANQEIILNLDKYFPNIQDIKMLENFRSTNQITSLANKINDLRTDIVKKDLVSNKSGKDVELHDSSAKGTTETIIEKVKELIQNGTNLYDIGIIARTKQELQNINIRLQEEKIPCLVSVHEFLIDNPKIKNILGLPIFLLDNEKKLYLAEYLQAKDSDKFDSQTDIGVYVSEEAQRIIEELDELKANSTNIDKDLVNYFFKMLNDLDMTDKALFKLKEILESKTFANLNEVKEFLSKLKAYDSQLGVEKDEEAYDAVTLMTPHSAKGREFKIILAALDGFKFNDKKENEDNRCLFVTVTRAMEELYLYEDVSKLKSTSYYPIIEKIL